MTTKTQTHTEGRLTPVTGQGAHHRDIYLRVGGRREDGTWPAIAKCCSSNIGARVVVEGNGNRLAACWNACLGINPEAVPDLLAALRHCDRLAGCQGNAEDIWLALGEIRTIARAAIAKAEGTPQ